MEAIGAASSVLSFATAALQSIQWLIQTIENIKDTPQILRDVRADLEALDPILRSLESRLKPSPSQTAARNDRNEKIEKAVKNCNDICTAFREKLESWLKRSASDDKPGKMDTVWIGMFRDKRIQSLKLRLSGSKETLTLILVANNFMEMPEKEDLQSLTSRFESHMITMESSYRQLLDSSSPLMDPEEQENRKQLLVEVRNQVDSDKSLKKLCEEAIASIKQAMPDKGAREEKVWDLRSRVMLTDPSDDRIKLIKAKGERVEGTCEWILSNSTYRNWLEGRPSFLWMSGEPGKGKTMLSIFLSEQLATHISSEEPNTHLIYYFCSQQDEKRNTAAAVLRGLLWQLTKKPEFTTRLAKHLATQDRVILSDPESLWKLFAAVVEDTDSGKIYCVLDGLDECDEESRLWLARKLLSLFSPGASEPHLHVLRLVLISRDIPEYKLRGQSVRVSLDTDAQNEINADIATVIARKARGISGWQDFSNDFQEKVQDELMRRAEGTFLTVDYMLKEVSTETTSIGVMETLLSTPQGLPAQYSRMVLRIAQDRRSETLQLLRWVAMAARPLTLRELSMAMTDSTKTYDTMAELIIRTKVAVCDALLVVQEDGTVGFRHASARDYLLRTAGDETQTSEQFDHAQAEILEQFRLEPTKAHLEIALRCLQLIKESHLQHRIIDSPEDLGETSILHYAVVYWPVHARHASEAGKTLFTSPSFILTSQPSLAQSWWTTYVSHSKGEAWEQGRVLSPLHIACRFGIVEWVRALLANVKGSAMRKLIDGIDFYGLTPLAWAAIEGHETVVALLLDSGADVNGTTHLYARDGLSWASPDGAMSYIRELKTGASIWNRELTSLHRAAYKGHAGVVRLLLERGADVHFKGWARCTPIHAAAIGGNVEVMGLLLKHGGDADVDAELKAVHTTPLHYAAEYGNHEAAGLLLDHGADINKRQKFSGSTVLFFAPERDAKPKLVESLLDRGADVNARDKHHRKPLHYFVMRHARPASIKLLLDAGAKINSKNLVRETALDLALECMCEVCQSTTQLLLAHGGALHSPSSRGKKNHPELFVENDRSVEPLPQFSAPSIASSDTDRTSVRASIAQDQVSLADRTSIAESDSVLDLLPKDMMRDDKALNSQASTSAKDSVMDSAPVQSDSIAGSDAHEDDEKAALGKRARMSAWVKRKLHT